MIHMRVARHSCSEDLVTAKLQLQIASPASSRINRAVLSTNTVLLPHFLAENTKKCCSGFISQEADVSFPAGLLKKSATST